MSLRWLPMVFYKKTFVLLFVGFVLATIVGTITHELGHWAIVEMMGFDAAINYGSTYLIDDRVSMTTIQLALFTLGGPLQTILTGTIGGYILYKRKHQLSAGVVNLTNWIMVLLTLFWLRQPANFFMWLYDLVVFNQISYYGDEQKLAMFLSLPIASVLIATASAGVAVLLWVISILPANVRLTFLLSLAGGVVGFVAWFGGLGEFLLP